MRKRPVVIACALLLAAGAFSFRQYVALDEAGYEKVVKQSVTLKEDEAPVSPHVFQQNRRGVVKDVCRNHNGQRTRLSLKSADSHLLFEENEMIEKMSDVVCVGQEELYFVLPDGREALACGANGYLLRNGDPASSTDWFTEPGSDWTPMQSLRYLESGNATYHYRQDRFVADRVTIKRYKIPGHTLPLSLDAIKPTVEATAESVEISLLHPEKKMKARKLRATFYTKEES